MNSIKKFCKLAVMTTSMTLFFAGSAIAAFTLNGTRFIYEEGKKNISFEVSSSSDDIYGAQVWIENPVSVQAKSGGQEISVGFSDGYKTKSASTEKIQLEYVIKPTQNTLPGEVCQVASTLILTTD